MYFRRFFELAKWFDYRAKEMWEELQAEMAQLLEA